MDVTKIANQVTAPTAGDGGEAVSGGHQAVSADAPVKQDIPRDAGWFVAVVRCNCEVAIGRSIELDLREQNIWFEYWIPMQKVVVFDKRSKKRKTKERVLLTTFIFCHVSKRQLDTIRFRSDVYKMLTMPGQRVIYRIRDKELEDYRRLVENPDKPVTPCSGPLKKGQRVRITQGMMAGLEAYVQRISGTKAIIGNEIKYISGATIEIDRAFLEVIPNEKSSND